MDTVPRTRSARRSAVLAAAVLLSVVLTPGRANAADVTPPSQPGIPVASNATTHSLTLTWTPSTDDVAVVRYDVRQTYSDMVQSRTTTTNSIVINDLNPARTYSFVVSAIDAAGNRSAQSPSLRITMPPGDTQAPSTPGTPTVSALTPTALTLTWAPSIENVALFQYRIYRIEGGSRSLVTAVWQQPGGRNSTQLTNLTPGTTYTFAVEAVDDAGNVSPLSPSVTVTTPTELDSTPPTVPGTPTVTAVTATSVQLAWAPSSDASGIQFYRIYEAPDGVTTYGYRTVPAAGGATITGLLPGTSYTFEVAAVDTAGNVSTRSGRVTVSTATSDQGCAVAYRITGQWPGAFQASVSIRNTSATPIPFSALNWRFANAQSITSAWRVGSWSMAGASATVTGPSWQRTIQPGGVASFGFQASWHSVNTVPVEFWLNGVACARAA